MYTAERLNKSQVRVSSASISMVFTDKRGWSDKRIAKKVAFHDKIDQVKSAVNCIIANAASSHSFGHAFLWAIIKVDGKHVRLPVGYGCVDDWSTVEATMKAQIPEVVNTWVNMD